MNPANQLFIFGMTIGIMLVGMDLLTRVGGPKHHAMYRKMVGKVFGYFRKHFTTFVKWAWKNHWKLIVGFGAGYMAALYFTNQLPK